MRLAQVSCLVVVILLAAPAYAAVDGKVAGLNEPTFAALATIKQRNPVHHCSSDFRRSTSTPQPLTYCWRMMFFCASPRASVMPTERSTGRRPR